MKTISLLTFVLFVLVPGLISAQVSINNDGTPPNNSAMLEVKSTTKGLLPPRMTHAQIDAIASPANGLIVYCTDCGTSGTGAMYQYVNGAWNTVVTCLAPTKPVGGNHVPSGTQVVWTWNAVSSATGYKWGATAVYASATDMGTATTKTETGLNCGTAYTRYVWAYNACGSSSAALIASTTTGTAPAAPVAGSHAAAQTTITWNWNTVAGAAGYKWSTTNNYATAIDMGTATSKTETGLVCNTAFTRYVWAYGACGYSVVTALSQSTLTQTVNTPTAATLVPCGSQITWNWNTVSGATGYKWNTTDNFSTATDVGSATTKTETGLAASTSYSRYVWAYTSCSYSQTSLLLNQTTTQGITTPVEMTHQPSGTQIFWNWTGSPGAAGYKWNTTNDFNSASTVTNAQIMEYNLTPGVTYTRYVWSFDGCGHSPVTILTQPLIYNLLSYGGGIIFAMEINNKHGWISASSDQGLAPWGCEGIEIAGQGNGMGAGIANTIAIVNGCSQPGIAARICFDLSLNGFDDWYLPSFGELGVMYNARIILNMTSVYWSSNQLNENNAMGRNFNNGIDWDWPKSTAWKVRAIRYF